MIYDVIFSKNVQDTPEGPLVKRVSVRRFDTDDYGYIELDPDAHILHVEAILPIVYTKPI